MLYETLLRWLFTEVTFKASNQRHSADSLLALCHEIDLSTRKINFISKVLICGIEAHHDGSGRIDFGIIMEGDQPAITAAAILPAWWTYLMTRSGEQDALLPRRYSLEFDARPDQTPLLAGIFQAVEPPDSSCPATQAAAVNSLLTHLGRLEFPTAALETSRSLRLCLEQLGIPEQVGIMSGRGDLIKLVHNVSGVPVEAMEAVFAALRAGQSRWSQMYDDKLIAALQSPNLGPLVRLSLDIDLMADHLLPQLGIEIATNLTERGQAPAALLSFCREVIGLDAAPLASFSLLAAQLPVGYRRRPKPALTLIDRRTERQDHLRKADLSHVKIVLKPGHQPALKSYLEARQLLLSNPQP